MSSKTCHYCGCSEIDIDQARGNAVCTKCGSVLEDNIIVSEVQFEENAHGGSSSIGQFVSLDGKVSRRLNDGLHTGYGQESRLVTLENGRKKIVEVAQQLRLNQHCIDTAFNFFKMAVHRRLTRGRRHCNVIAACLYIVCRTEATPHMLLDFCDVLQVNVYDLGKTYLRLSAALCINIPAIDPCLYIVRFAHRLQFDDKTHEVSMTALRLVQRMKRDWMHTGRRPSGLCGAALLVAARLHGFNRTLEDMIKVVKVCTATLRKRLNEFGDTPSSRLTLEEFMTIDLEEEQDPPAFIAARKRAKMQQLEDQNKVDEATNEISKLQQQIEKMLEEKKSKLKGIQAQYASLNEDNSSQDVDVEKESSDAVRFVEDETIEAIAEFVAEDRHEEALPIIASLQQDLTSCRKLESNCNSENTAKLPSSDVSKELIAPTWSRSPMKGLGPTAASLGLKETIEECMKVTITTASAESGELDLTGIDDEELDDYIMTADEVKRKSDLWHLMNAEYLKELKEKEEREAKEKEESANKPEKKKRKPRKRNPIQANSAGEAIEKMLQEKKISNKINYDVLRNLNSKFDSPSANKSGKKIDGNSPFTTSLRIAEDDEDPPKAAAHLTESRGARHTPAAKRKRDELGEIETTNSKAQVDDKVEYVVENGPLTYEDEGATGLDGEEEYDEYEDETSVTAQLLRQHQGDEDDDYEDCGEYYD